MRSAHTWSTQSPSQCSAALAWHCKRAWRERESRDGHRCGVSAGEVCMLPAMSVIALRCDRQNCL